MIKKEHNNWKAFILHPIYWIELLSFTALKVKYKNNINSSDECLVHHVVDSTQ